MLPRFCRARAQAVLITRLKTNATHSEDAVREFAESFGAVRSVEFFEKTKTHGRHARVVFEQVFAAPLLFIPKQARERKRDIALSFPRLRSRRPMEIQGFI